METYGKILVIAVPIFLLLVIIEKIYGYLKGEDTVPLMDAASSLSSGITNAVKDVLQISISIISYEWMVSKFSIFQLQSSVLAYIIAFIVIDFHGYWTHRISHQVNFFWNKHAIHHSSEEFNLACALHQSISSFVSVFTFLLIPAAILGVPAKVISIAMPIQLFAQFWYHTRHINKMGILEKILVTPSHHRVHHAINKVYMDKNLSQIFIFWDKLFGTFQEELKSDLPVYGITRPAETWNPIRINFQHLWLLVKDAWHANSWKDKLLIWIKPTGWRPIGFEEKYPVNKITDVYSFKKFGYQTTRLFNYWIIFQLVITILFALYFFNNIASIGFPMFFVYAAFIFITIFSYTELMDRNKFAFLWELLRLFFGLGIMYFTNDWFGIKSISSNIIIAIVFYLFISAIITLYFSKKNTVQILA